MASLGERAAAAARIRTLDLQQLAKDAIWAESAFEGDVDAKEGAEYARISRAYKPFLDDLASMEELPYASLRNQTEALKTLGTHLQGARSRLELYGAATASELAQLLDRRHPDYGTARSLMRRAREGLIAAGQERAVARLEEIVKTHASVDEHDDGLATRLRAQERRLTDLWTSYDGSAANVTSAGCVSATHDLRAHAAALSENAEALHEEIRERRPDLAESAVQLVAGAERLERRVTTLRDHAREHARRKLGWYAAKVGSGVILLVGAIQFTMEVDQYFRERPGQATVQTSTESLHTAPVPSIISTLARTNPWLTYVLYLSRDQHRGILYELGQTPRQIHAGPCTFGARPGDKEVQGDGRTQEGIFGIESLYLGRTVPRYGAGFINLQDKPFKGLQVTGTRLPERLAAIKGAYDATNGAASFRDEDMIFFLNYMLRHGSENGMVVIEHGQRPLLGVGRI